MTQGKIVEYIDQGRFVCTICLQDKGGRLHLLTPSNREVNLSPKRTILVSEPTIDISQSREDLLERLKQIEETRIRLKEQIDVEGLWELVHDEDETFDHEYLAQLVFGEAVTEDHASAIVRALFENRLYFKMKNGQFLPNSKKKVEQIIRQQAEEAATAERLRQGCRWLKEIQQGKETDEPPCKADIVHLLTQLALHGKDAPEFKYGKELLSNVGISDIRQARVLLIQLGEWEEDENLDLLRSGLDVEFTERQLAATNRLSACNVDVSGREDLRELSSLTIDGPLTQDFDDAMSFEIIGDEIHIGVHIADVAAAISEESILDLAAAQRASSQYLPRRQIPMLPAELSQNVLSLKQGCDRKAISLSARFDKAGTLLDYGFSPSVIRVRQQLIYEDVNKSLEDDPQFQEMHQFSQRLRQNRMDQGALSLSLPELEVRFGDNGEFSLELVEQETPSRTIVAEFMILYNLLAAQFCMKNQIPILFRTQSDPSEKLPLDEKGYLYYVFQQRRKLSPLNIRTAPGPHSGLGVDVYCHATSPIRRYLDLVNQRQVHNYLFHEKTIYDEKRLEEIRMSAEPIIKKLGFIKRNRLRYWILKYLSLQRGEKLRALVLDELKNKYRVVLTDFLMIADLKRKDGVILSQGQEISVEVKKADPWDDILTLEYVEET
ncbi:MAG: RNB domain-containing ribonuclease [Deltaproteobacteria bacterium]|nr:RNB domain-containing ribonuclease [Deltaproteobacteria bacterium]